MKEISEALDMEPLNFPISEYTKPEIINSFKDDKLVTDNEVEEDLKDTRESYKELIESGTKAISDLSDIAEQSQSPRAYEVLSTLIRTIADTNKNLLELHKLKKELKTPEQKQQTINNNLILTTTELLNKLKNE